MVGIYGYSGSKDSLDFNKGDLLYIINRDHNKYWWYAKSKRTGKEGYIPYNYVAVKEEKVLEE